MPKLVLPISKVDNDDPGQVIAVTAVEDTVSLAGGLYKIAAMGQPLLWKQGTDAVTAAIGSYLAAGDQELIRMPAPVSPATDTPLRFISSADATPPGEINIVVVELFEVPAVDTRPYLVPV